MTTAEMPYARSSAVLLSRYMTDDDGQTVTLAMHENGTLTVHEGTSEDVDYGWDADCWEIDISLGQVKRKYRPTFNPAWLLIGRVRVGYRSTPTEAQVHITVTDLNTELLYRFSYEVPVFPGGRLDSPWYKTKQLA